MAERGSVEDDVVPVGRAAPYRTAFDLHAGKQSKPYSPLSTKSFQNLAERVEDDSLARFSCLSCSSSFLRFDLWYI